MGLLDSGRRTRRRVNTLVSTIDFEEEFIDRHSTSELTHYRRFRVSEEWNPGVKGWVVMNLEVDAGVWVKVELIPFPVGEERMNFGVEVSGHLVGTTEIRPSLTIVSEVAIWSSSRRDFAARKELILLQGDILSNSRISSRSKASFDRGAGEIVVQTRLKWSDIREMPSGLHNVHVTCYLNSFLQACFHLQGLRHSVARLPAEPGDFVFALQGLFLEMEALQGSAANPSGLLAAFGWKDATRLAQQDVQEFSVFFLDALDVRWKRAQISDVSPVRKLFEGQLCNEIKCLNVDFSSSRTELYNCISLSVQPGELKAAIQQYFEPETLEGDNAFAAGDFGKQPAQKSVRFSHLPPVLMLHINRFAYDPTLDHNVKLTDCFIFEEKLDLGFLGSKSLPTNVDPKRLNYSLYAVFVHVGDSAEAGHYKLLLRLPKGWVELNDDKVTPANWADVATQTFGAPLRSRRFDPGIGALEERLLLAPSHAYMLMYICDEDRASVLGDPPKRVEWPKPIISASASRLKAAQRLKKHCEEYKIRVGFPRSFENWETNFGSAFFRNSKNDSFQLRRLKTRPHLLLRVKRCAPVREVIEAIEREAGEPCAVFSYIGGEGLQPAGFHRGLVELGSHYKVSLLAIPSRLTPGTEVPIFVKSYDAGSDRMFVDRVLVMDVDMKLEECLKEIGQSISEKKVETDNGNGLNRESNHKGSEIIGLHGGAGLESQETKGREDYRGIIEKRKSNGTEAILETNGLGESFVPNKSLEHQGNGDTKILGTAFESYGIKQLGEPGQLGDPKELDSNHALPILNGINLENSNFNGIKSEREVASKILMIEDNQQRLHAVTHELSERTLGDVLKDFNMTYISIITIPVEFETNFRTFVQKTNTRVEVSIALAEEGPVYTVDADASDEISGIIKFGKQILKLSIGEGEVLRVTLKSGYNRVDTFSEVELLQRKTTVGQKKLRAIFFSIEQETPESQELKGPGLILASWTGLDQKILDFESSIQGPEHQIQEENNALIVAAALKHEMLQIGSKNPNFSLRGQNKYYLQGRRTIILEDDFPSTTLPRSDVFISPSLDFKDPGDSPVEVKIEHNSERRRLFLLFAAPEEKLGDLWMALKEIMDLSNPSKKVKALIYFDSDYRRIDEKKDSTLQDLVDDDKNPEIFISLIADNNTNMSINI